MAFKSGFVGIVGRPNVGKSTLLNQFLHSPLAITSPKPQTTRGRILGVLHQDDFQINFLDTPGLHKPENTLGEVMQAAAKDVIETADVLVTLIDGKAGLRRDDEQVFRMLRNTDQTKLLAINKVDAVAKQKLLPLIETCSRLGLFEEIFPISAKTGLQTDLLLEAIKRRLPEGPEWYGKDQVTDQNDRERIQEWIREPILHSTHEEVPHAVAVVVDLMEESEHLLEIHATIVVERPGQKAILIGKGGAMLKIIGSRARQVIESRFGKRVYLGLWVKVVKDWRGNPRMLKELGLIQ